MTDLEFTEALGELGCSEIVIRSQMFDFGHKLGVAAQFKKNDKTFRNAVRLSPDASVEDAYPVLLDWAAEQS